MLSPSLFYSYVLRHTCVFEANFPVYGRCTAYAFFYEQSNGDWEVFLEYDIPPDSAGGRRLSAFPPDLAAGVDRDEEFALWLRHCLRSKKSLGVTDFSLSDAAPRPPRSPGAPYRSEVDALVQASPFWVELPTQVSEVLLADAPAPDDWALRVARTLFATRASFSPCERALARLAAYNAERAAEGPRDRLQLLVEDSAAFEDQLPDAVKQGLDRAILQAQQQVHSPICYNRLDALNYLKAGMDWHKLLA